MRLGRLVAAGLVAGAVAGFVGALLRPRTVHSYRPDAERPATDPRGDLAAARPSAADERPGAGPGAVTEPVLDPVEGSQAYALATSAHDPSTEALEPPPGAHDQRADQRADEPADELPADPEAGTSEVPAPGGTGRLDVDALAAGAAPVAAAPVRGAHG